jgi:hypothetical protein
MQRVRLNDLGCSVQEKFKAPQGPGGNQRPKTKDRGTMFECGVHSAE